ncbi:hypothetical protein HK097_003855, partial [Rhizophlyctis rosea]
GQAGSGSGSGPRVVSAAVITEGDRDDVEGKGKGPEEEERDDVPGVGPSAMNFTEDVDPNATTSEDAQRDISPATPTVIVTNEADETVSVHSHTEDHIHDDTQNAAAVNSSNPESPRREGTPDEWGPPPLYS